MFMQVIEQAGLFQIFERHGSCQVLSDGEGIYLVAQNMKHNETILSDSNDVLRGLINKHPC